MRTLVLHSRYLTGPASGENRVVEDEARLLRQAGLEVTAWSPETRAGGLRAAADALWSRSAAERARALVDAGPDVVHVHSLYPRLSPAVLRAAAGLPTVMTLHNFRLQCLPATLLRNGAICEDCLGKVPWRGVVHGCYRGSRPASAVLAASLSLHRAIGSFDRVTLFVAVSAFVRDKLVAGGLDAARARVHRNFSWPLERRRGAGEYFLVLGRLSAEKGIDTVVRSVPEATRLVVAGDGPERHRLEAMANGRVEFVGAVDADEVPALLRDARALLFPSRCYEGSPRAVVEAMAAGVPVIASDIGGLPEHVSDDVNGLLLPPDDVDAWAEAIDRLRDDDLSLELGEGAYRRWQAEFSPEVALESLLAVYREAIDLHRRGTR